VKHLLKKRWLWCGLLLLGSVAVLLFPSSRWRLVGWVQGESFYKGRPTSYWRERVKQRKTASSSTGAATASSSTLWQHLRKHFAGSDITDERRPLLITRGRINIPDVDALPVLIELIPDTDADIAAYTFEKLRILGQNAAAAAPALIRQLDHADLSRRLDAASTLACIGSDHPELVPILLALLQELDPDDSSSAISALGQLGPKARSAFPFLLALWHRNGSKFEYRPTFGYTANVLGAALLEIDREAAEAAGVYAKRWLLPEVPHSQAEEAQKSAIAE